VLKALTQNISLQTVSWWGWCFGASRLIIIPTPSEQTFLQMPQLIACSCTSSKINLFTVAETAVKSLGEGSWLPKISMLGTVFVDTFRTFLILKVYYSSECPDFYFSAAGRTTFYTMVTSNSGKNSVTNSLIYFRAKS
jgi:hypothetical protein